MANKNKDFKTIREQKLAEMKRLEGISDVKERRTERSKTYHLEGRKYQAYCYTGPIFYKNRKTNKWEDIELKLGEENDKYLCSKNKVSYGFRKDKKLHKYVGIRYDEAHQFEITPISIIISGKKNSTKIPSNL